MNNAKLKPQQLVLLYEGMFSVTSIVKAGKVNNATPAEDDRYMPFRGA